MTPRERRALRLNALASDVMRRSRQERAVAALLYGTRSGSVTPAAPVNTLNNVTASAGGTAPAA